MKDIVISDTLVSGFCFLHKTNCKVLDYPVYSEFVQDWFFFHYVFARLEGSHVVFFADRFQIINSVSLLFSISLNFFLLALFPSFCLLFVLFSS